MVDGVNTAPTRRLIGAALSLAVAGVFLGVSPTAAAEPVDSVQQAVDAAVSSAAAQGITQSISVVDRASGAAVASSGGSEQYISESIVKLFTVAYYEVQADGRPDDSMAQTLRTMIINSDDDIESSLWNVDIVPTIAARYGLADTRNGPKTGPHDWGWEVITADDETRFLYEMSNDPVVSPLLMDAMANSAPTGADGADQFFGMNTLPGDHGSKQGWTDVGAGSSEPAEIHSVGWTDRYFVAILQTAAGPDFDAMRATATAAAQAVYRAQQPAAVSTDAPTAESDQAQNPADSPAASPPTAAASAAPPAPGGQFAHLITALRHDVDVLLADVAALLQRW